MATWQKEIMKLANDLCLNMTKAKQIVIETDTLSVPQGKCETEWKYDRAYSRILHMIMNM